VRSRAARAEAGYALGGYPYISDQLRLAVAFAYRQDSWQDRSIYRYDKEIQTYEVGIHVERVLRNARVWLGPIYRVDRVLEFSGGRLAVRAESIDALGLRVGGSILLASHYIPFVQLDYVGGIQATLGLGYQL
jgi:hypothetical protein